MNNESTRPSLPISEIDPPYRERYAELLEIIEAFCAEHLNDEYNEVCCRLAADCCQDGSPNLSGQAKSWAAGIIWTAGRVNFLSDPSTKPTMTQAEFAKAIRVSPATISAKSREIWDALDLTPLDVDYTISSRMQCNPMIWLFEVGGKFIDFRTAPRDVQKIAFEEGLIPYIPADRENE